jgi:hypothetical protein
MFPSLLLLTGSPQASELNSCWSIFHLFYVKIYGSNSWEGWIFGGYFYWIKQVRPTSGTARYLVKWWIQWCYYVLHAWHIGVQFALSIPQKFSPRK